MEIDTEVVNLLADTAQAETSESLTWSRVCPIGVSKQEHYAGFGEIINIGKQIVYDRTRKFMPTYIIIASDILPVIQFVPGFTAAPTTEISGPYFAGSVYGLKVFVSPALAAGKFVLGVNGSDAMTSAAVYAPYMPIVPTQLLGFADGGMSQGFSTLYDLKVLNSKLLVMGTVTGASSAYVAGTQASQVYNMAGTQA